MSFHSYQSVTLDLEGKVERYYQSWAQSLAITFFNAIKISDEGFINDV